MSAGSPLRAEELTVTFGERTALRDVSLAVGSGQLVAVFGEPGAGKTTLLRTLAGMIVPARGKLWLGAQRIPAGDAERARGMGIAYVNDDVRLIPGLSVADNIRLRVARAGGVRREWNAAVDAALERFPRLVPRRDKLAGVLPASERQLLAFACAVATNPRVVLVDEPRVSPHVMRDVSEGLRALVRDGAGVLIAERAALWAVDLAEQAYVLVAGRIARSTTAVGAQFALAPAGAH